MPACTRTFDFLGLTDGQGRAGGLTTIYPDFAGNSPDPSSFNRQPDPIAAPERSISGHQFLRGTTYAETFTFPFDRWVVTEAQMQIIDAGYRLANHGTRLLPGNLQSQFRLHDELLLYTDTQTPERAYVPGSLSTVSPGGGGTNQVSRYYPIFYAVFLTVPKFSKIAATDPGTAERLYEMTMTLGEGDIYLASEQLTPPITSFSLTASLSADTNTSGGPVQFAVVS